MQVQDRLFIGGEWVAPSGPDTFDVISPATEEVIARIAEPTPADVDKAVAAARTAFDEGPWPRLDPAERVSAVRRLAALYKPGRAELASLITAEMGAPISFAKVGHVAIPMFMMNAFAGIAENLVWEEKRPGFYGQDILVRKEPVGVVGAIVPWNMPMHLTIGKLVPALLAGCSVVLKPSPETPLDAYWLAGLLEQADIPPGVVSILPAGREIGEYLVSHPGIDKVSFTGSTAAGRKVAAACGANLKRVGLELGGKSAAVVLDDADPAAMAKGVEVAGLMNSGQACVAQTRVLVPRSRYAEYVDALAAMVESLPTGDPTDPATAVGPLVAQRQQERVRGYIEVGQKEGARLVAGGADLPAGVDRGWYIRPTLFADVDSSMRIAQEEIFGPVLSVIPYTDEAEAVRIADATEYGLSGSVWTADVERGLGVARRVRSGTFGVNEAYSMDPAAPFGGVKASGIGRELGKEGIEGFLDSKSISIAARR
ncbi:MULTISPECIES: aldehyde dehydrogenase [unclassified Pseudofrankia]|uniref:aldehyde dehydrogenase n=1 Tax=unclassified Pseudofrankia TaxID=2994372 RepID=UPI0008DB03A1|nr:MULTISPECIES: aldehyde dehydrogenase [unclassified Pseudofrankia]MDT3444026.1 aldehyde dehydrogenase [Pseudofrankia sp. BMG5.37]OHV65257.1 aldehyde dehydrogenase [Pseudofrankia sp. BMG5.36]